MVLSTWTQTEAILWVVTQPVADNCLEGTLSFGEMFYVTP